MAKKRTTRKVRSTKNIDPLSAMALMQGTGADTVLFGKRGFRELSHTPGRRNPDDYWNILRVERYDSSASRHVGLQNFPDGQLEKAKKFAKSEAKFWRQQTRIMQGNMERAQFSSEGKERSVGKRNPEDIDFLNALAPIPSLGHISFTPDGIERYYRDGFTYQAFSSTPVFADGYRMGTPEAAVDVRESINPKTGKKHFIIVNRSTGQEEGYFWNKSAATNALTSIAKRAYEVKTITAPPPRDNPRRRNPASEADALYEDFHGTPPTETLEYHETLHFHAHLGGLADLCHVVVKIIGGSKNGKELQLNAPDPERADEADVVKLTANEARNQLYLTGGDQSLDLKSLGFRESFDVVHDGETFESTEIKDNMVIGYIYRLMYRTEKKFDNFETIDYHHEAGEDTGCLPFLTYDTLNSKMGVAGGSYVIHEKGIVN